MPHEMPGNTVGFHHPEFAIRLGLLPVRFRGILIIRHQRQWPGLVDRVLVHPQWPLSDDGGDRRGKKQGKIESNGRRAGEVTPHLRIGFAGERRANCWPPWMPQEVVYQLTKITG